MDSITAQPARGMRDLLPQLMQRRAWVVDRLVDTFERFAFVPLDTPALERAETLLGKYGPDAERLIFRAGLRGEQDLALRYDHSVPLARVCAAWDELPRPLRRYQVGPVWRGDRPQRGRYREFVQADVDIVGSGELLADAEILAVAVRAMTDLGLSDAATLLLNNRKLLEAIGRYAGVPEALLPGLYRAIDKRDAIGLDGVRLELLAVGLPGELVNRQRQGVERYLRDTADRARLAADLEASMGPEAPDGLAERALPAYLDALAEARDGGATPDDVQAVEASVMARAVEAMRAAYPPEALVPVSAVNRLLDLLATGAGGAEALDALGAALDDPLGRAGIAEIREVVDLLAASGQPTDAIRVDPAMVRGLEYYTGTIFEAVVPDVDVGSVLSGGRYDKLTSSFGRDLPAVGMSFGVDRIVVALDELGRFPASVDGGAAEVLVARFDEATTRDALALAGRLREAGVATETYLSPDRIGDQIRYALKRDIPVVAIVGPDEAASGRVTLRDLGRRAEQSVPLDEALGVVERMLDGESTTDVEAGA